MEKAIFNISYLLNVLNLIPQSLLRSGDVHIEALARGQKNPKPLKVKGLFGYHEPSVGALPVHDWASDT